MANFIFQETQGFRQVWIWVILVGIAPFSIRTLYFSNPPKQFEAIEQVLPILAVFSFILLFGSFRFKSRIDYPHLIFNFFPVICEGKDYFKEFKSEPYGS
jgi:hypothetical protein